MNEADANGRPGACTMDGEAPVDAAHHGSWRLVRPDGSYCVLVLQRATRFGARLRGLLGRALPAPGHGLWLEPCRSVHSFGMHGRIDLLFVDDRSQVLEAHSGFAPWRIASCRRARSAIELRAGEVLRLCITTGSRLEPHAIFFPSAKD